MPLRLAGVLGQRADERIARVLLHDVGGPAGDARRGEQRRERLGVETHQVVGRTRRVVEVRLDAFALIHRRLERRVQVEQLLPVVMLDQRVEGGLHRRHARVPVLVDPVTETHDLALRRERFVEPGGGAVCRADLVERVHHGFVRAAVERPLQRADRAGDRRVHVAQRRRDHPGGEGGRVEGVLGVQHQRDAESVDDHRIRNLSERHVEEVLRIVEVVPRLDQVEPAAATLLVRDDRRQLRQQVDGAAVVQFGIQDSAGLEEGGVERAELADRGADGIHRMRGHRQVVDHASGARIEGPQRTLERLEGDELIRRRKVAVQQQVRHLFVRTPRGELLHRVTAVEQGIRLRVDARDGGRVDDDAGETFVDLLISHDLLPARAPGERAMSKLYEKPTACGRVATEQRMRAGRRRRRVRGARCRCRRRPSRSRAPAGAPHARALPRTRPR